MKKLLVVMLLCGVAIQASYAQTEKGTQNLGLSFGVNTSTSRYPTYYPNGVEYNESKNNIYSIKPSYSYFIADKLDIAIEAGFAYSEQSNNNVNSLPQKQSLRTLSGGVQLRKYFLFNDKIGVRTGPTFTYERGKQTYEFSNYNKSTYDIDTYTGGLKLDFVYFPFKKVGFAANVGNINYSYSKQTQEDYKTTTKSFNANFVNSLNLSFFYIF